MASLPLAPLDAVYFLVESPAHLMTIGSVWRFAPSDVDATASRPPARRMRTPRAGAAARPVDAPPTAASPTQRVPTAAAGVLAAFERWTVAFPVYRDRLVATHRPGFFGALQRRWEPDPDFRIEHHVSSVLLERAISLDRLVAQLVATPFDPARPPWVAYHVAFARQPMNEPEQGDAVVICCHHAFTDGVGAVRSFLQLTQPSPTASASEAPPWHAHDVPPRDGVVRERAAAVLAAAQACRPFALAWALVVLAVVLWVHALVSAADLARIAAKYARVWLHRRRAFHTPSSAHGVGKQYASTRLASLDAVKAVAHARGATVNDVVLAVLTGALRPVPGGVAPLGRPAGEVNCIVPVSLRHDDDWAPGNHVTVCVVQLPAWAPDPLQRLDLVHRRLDRIKHSLEVWQRVRVRAKGKGWAAR